MGKQEPSVFSRHLKEKHVSYPVPQNNLEIDSHQPFRGGFLDGKMWAQPICTFVSQVMSFFRFFRIQLLRPNIKDPCPSVDWCFSASSTWVQNNDFGMQPPCDPWPRQVVGLPGVPGYPAAIGRTSTRNSVWLFFKSFELWQTIFTHVYCIHFYLSIW
jgi:hypothetical protein